MCKFFVSFQDLQRNNGLFDLAATAVAPSPGWDPRGQGPSRNRQGPGINNWTDHVPSGLPYKNFGILGHFVIKN